jgi:hypothetical protein
MHSLKKGLSFLPVESEIQKRKLSAPPNEGTGRRSHIRQRADSANVWGRFFRIKNLAFLPVDGERHTCSVRAITSAERNPYTF